MLYAVLMCSDEGCAEEFEAWGEPVDFEALLCEGCGCTLHAVAFCDVSTATVTRLPRRIPHVQLRQVA